MIMELTATAKAPMYTRGSLKIDVVTSEPVITASGDFSILVNITNPYDVPVTLYSVQTHMPVELIDSIWVEKYYLAERSAHLTEIEEQEGWKKLLARGKYAWLNFAHKLRTPTSPRIAEAFSLESEKPQIKAPPIAQRTHIEGDVSHSTIGQLSPFSEFWQLQFPQNPTNDDLDRIFMKVEDFRKGKIPTILQPGDSVVRQFVLKPKRWLFFTPIEYVFHIQVRFAADNTAHSNNVSFRLNIRAALKAIMIGAVVGSILGATARTLGVTGGTLSTTSFTLAVIFGVIAVIGFARKADAQQIVSVEDFWGGLLIGFLVGYLGESYFRRALGLG
jgi:hypothetical protein